MNGIEFKYHAKGINDLSSKLITTFKGYINLSPKENEVLSYFLSLHLTGKTEFDSQVRKDCMNELGLSRFSLNNYIKSLKDMKLLQYSPNGNLIIGRPFNVLKPIENNIEIKFIFNV